MSNLQERGGILIKPISHPNTLEHVGDISELVLRSTKLSQALEEALKERRMELIEMICHDIINNASMMRGWVIQHRDEFK
jgi:hypothetical protein